MSDYFTSSSPKMYDAPQISSGNDLSAPTVCPEYIGGPPEMQRAQTNTLKQNSRLVLYLKPAVAKFSQGISLFQLDTNEGRTRYMQELQKSRYSVPPSFQQDGLKLVVQADQLPVDSFTNEYGEHFLSQIGNFGGGALAQMMQMSDSQTSGELFKKIGGGAKEYSKEFPKGMTKDLIEGVGNLASWAGDTSEKSINKLKGSKNPMVRDFGAGLETVLSGARLDFPLLWMDSGYSPSFTCTVRLYNPQPSSIDSTKKYILAPLAALLTCALPQADKNNMGYKYPFFCKVECKGLFIIKAGAISNITVVKGGDQGLLAYNQRSQIVDVRLEFINLHRTMIISDDGRALETRATLNGYLKNMEDAKVLKSIKEPSATANALSKLAKYFGQGLGTEIADRLMIPAALRVNQRSKDLENQLKNN